jgi:hypothetical protein
MDGNHRTAQIIVQNCSPTISHLKDILALCLLLNDIELMKCVPTVDWIE